MSIEIKVNQIPSKEQMVILEALGESVAKHDCLFLEVGSWCGDSAIILGNIAKKNCGHLFCIDWWKGNVGCDLAEIASKVDVFSFFWDRIIRAGLEDVVIPIRGDSVTCSKILKKYTFDLIFLDGDHRYNAVKADIQNYSKLVSRNNGIICGHDCEGRVSDYDRAFLITGKNVDYYESVHCGVVLAVDECFTDYSINYNIWSVQSTDKDIWKKPELSLLKINDKRQLPPPPIGFSKNYLIYRYGKQVYAIPRSDLNFDITDEKIQKGSDIITAETSQHLNKIIPEKIVFSTPTDLLELYNGYNIVYFLNKFYALSMTLGPIDIISLDNNEIQQYISSNDIIVGNSISELTEIINGSGLSPPNLIEEGYWGFNIVLFKNKFYAISQKIGHIDLTEIEESDIKKLQIQFKLFIGDSYYELMFHVNLYLLKELTLIESTKRFHILQQFNRINCFIKGRSNPKKSS